MKFEHKQKPPQGHGWSLIKPCEVCTLAKAPPQLAEHMGEIFFKEKFGSAVSLTTGHLLSYELARKCSWFRLPDATLINLENQE